MVSYETKRGASKYAKRRKRKGNDQGDKSRARGWSTIFKAAGTGIPRPQGYSSAEGPCLPIHHSVLDTESRKSVPSPLPWRERRRWGWITIW